MDLSGEGTTRRAGEGRGDGVWMRKISQLQVEAETLVLLRRKITMAERRTRGNIAMQTVIPNKLCAFIEFFCSNGLAARFFGDFTAQIFSTQHYPAANTRR